ncbi:UDP-N-acetylmuramoyl-L-alanine--D-glutamate ligase [Baekduia soli]|uniref:UDP-N-acetylmuramoyl-L-alanine--D-glutamate ligase n=1 Tax=Baekduia soli TaxID=496014 RepID=A0A5B8U684_9ACTN|nr:UDP-N-acetylmuramoyl-L-alanine--D-glutamate ligase [Baekduia soli]QEC48604.1 UDP-N-acetylmuramoyl-L-alanine--D-glutamate ligase [Baekduia soli]
MRPRPPLPPGPWLVVGMARSGQAAAALLHARGERVVATDRAPAARLGDVALPEGVVLHAGTDSPALLEGVRAVVKSPGVPAQAPVIAAARQRGVPVLGELELAWRCVPDRVIAVTGTNGKTTTVELLGHLHREAGVPVAVVGNVGTAYASLALHPPAPETVVVCEASSFQLEDTSAFAPETAVLLNLDSDHLDRHGTLEAYHAAKLRIFAHQGNDDVAVAPEGLGIPDLGGCARRVCFGESPEAELSLRAGTLWWDREPLLRADELALRGPHNVRNAMAAAAAVLAGGMDADAVRAGLRTFAGVPHRLEEVARRDGVIYVNDSKATNVAAALVALRSFTVPVHVILGGRGKGRPTRRCARPSRRTPSRRTSSARRRPRCTPRWRAPWRCTTAATWPPRWTPRGPRPSPARSSSWPRRAPRSTSSRTSRRAGRLSGSWRECRA